MRALLTVAHLADCRALRLRCCRAARRSCAGSDGDDMRQGGEGFAPLLGRGGAFGYRLSMLHGDKPELDRLRSPPTRLRGASAAPPRVFLFRGRLRQDRKLMDEMPTRAPAIKLKAQSGAGVPLRRDSRGSLCAVIAGREPSSGWPIAPSPLRLVRSACPAVARPRGPAPACRPRCVQL